MNAGMILPAGSPLVQFEVTQPHDGYSQSEAAVIKANGLPRVIWVNRNGHKVGDTSFGCPVCTPGSGRLVFAAPMSNDVNGHAGPHVCLCMGRFVE